MSASRSRKARASAVRKHLMVNRDEAGVDNPKNLTDTYYANSTRHHPMTSTSKWDIDATARLNVNAVSQPPSAEAAV